MNWGPCDENRDADDVTPGLRHHDEERDDFTRVSVRRNNCSKQPPPYLHTPPLCTALHNVYFCILSETALIDHRAFDRGRVLMAGHKPHQTGNVGSTGIFSIWECFRAATPPTRPLPC